MSCVAEVGEREAKLFPEEQPWEDDGHLESGQSTRVRAQAQRALPIICTPLSPLVTTQ